MCKTAKSNTGHEIHGNAKKLIIEIRQNGVWFRGSETIEALIREARASPKFGLVRHAI